MSNNYNTNMLRALNAMQQDLEKRKINEKQFNFLLGFLFQNEMNRFINNEIKEMLPDSNNKMTFVSYQRDSKLMHA